MRIFLLLIFHLIKESLSYNDSIPFNWTKELDFCYREDFELNDLYRPFYPDIYPIRGCSFDEKNRLYEEKAYKVMQKYNLECVGCSAGVNGISIRNDGTVTPCTLLYISCGNILTDNLDDTVLNPINDILSDIVYNAKGSNVYTTIVNGKILMENRKTMQDEKEIYIKCKKIIERISN